MKTIIYLLSVGIGYLSSVWAVVEFLLYLLKDSPFNWISIQVVISMFLIAFITGVFIELGNKKKAID